jgi:hypothetical protein
MTYLLKRDDPSNRSRDESMGMGMGMDAAGGLGAVDVQGASTYIESLWARYFWVKAAAVVGPVCAVLYLLLRFFVEAHMLAHAVVIKNTQLGSLGQPPWMAARST